MVDSIDTINRRDGPNWLKTAGLDSTMDEDVGKLRGFDDSVWSLTQHLHCPTNSWRSITRTWRDHSHCLSIWTLRQSFHLIGIDHCSAMHRVAVAFKNGALVKF